jgi:hypothetical protein
MPLDLIDAETYAQRLDRLNASLVEAQRAYDRAVFAAETGSGSETDVTNARGNLQAIRDRIDSLGRAREVSKAGEAQAASAQQARGRREHAGRVNTAAAAAKTSAAEAQALLEALVAKLEQHDEHYRELDHQLTGLICGKPRERIVLDGLRHRFDGPLIVGHLRAANVPSLDTIDDPVSAMREHADHSLGSLVAERIDRALNLAVVDVPELRETAAAGE